MNKTEALKRLESIEEETKKLKAIIEAPEKALRVVVGGFGVLNIEYGDDIVGYVSRIGRCFILSSDNLIEIYNQWRKDGMPIDSTPEEWRGGEYYINEHGLLTRSDIDCGAIYGFKNCTYSPHCEDTNIKRFEHNKKPIGY